MFKLRTGDTVKVVAGKDKGKEAKIEKIFPKKLKVLLPGINLYKKHVKGTAQRGGQKGGIYEIPRPVPVSNVMLICSKCKKAARVGFRFAGSEKVRMCKKCGKEISIKKIVKKSNKK